MTRKMPLPPKSHIQIAKAVTDVVASADEADIESLPAKVRESLDYFNEVAEVAQRIETEQPQALAPHRDDLIEALVESGAVGAEANLASSVIDALLSSHAMARVLAEVGAGNIDPVATAAKSTRTTPAARPAAKKSAPAARRGRKNAQSGDQPAGDQPVPTPVTPNDSTADSDPNAKTTSGETKGASDEKSAGNVVTPDFGAKGDSAEPSRSNATGTEGPAPVHSIFDQPADDDF